MNFVKSILTLAAMTLIIVGVSGSTCIYNAPACSTITDPGGCIAPICALTAAGACVAATAATCGAKADLTGAATGDCSKAAADSAHCAAVVVQNGPTGTASPVCAFTAGQHSCIPNIVNEAAVCPTLANACTLNQANEATVCATFSTDTTCNANAPFCAWNGSSCAAVSPTQPLQAGSCLGNTTSADCNALAPYCAWNGSSCAAVSPGTCTVNLSAENTACSNIFDADRCVQNNGAFCIWDNNTGLCGPRNTSAPSSGPDFNACAGAAASAALCAGVQVNGTSVCTASSSQIGNDTAACAAANATTTTCGAVVVGSTPMCTFAASTCTTSGSNGSFCTDLADDGTTHVLTTCNPLSTTQPGTGADVTACAGAITQVVGDPTTCAAVTVGSSSACRYFADTCSVDTTAGVTAAACAGVNVLFCTKSGSGKSKDFCEIDAL